MPMTLRTKLIFVALGPLVYIISVELESVMILCPVKPRGPPSQVAPRWVVLSDQPCGPPYATLPIDNLHNRTVVTNFTACLHKPLQVFYKNVAQFVEWIEYHRVLGAQKFVVYNYTCDDALLPYFNYYQDLGLLEYRRWPLHDIRPKITFTRAQEGMIIDCVYRYMYKTKYLALMDVDEILMPMKHNNWNNLMENVPCKDNPVVHFQHRFLTYEKTPIPDPYSKILYPTGFNLETLTRIHMYDKSWKCPDLSKVIIQPERVTIPCLHTMFHQGECCIPTDLAVMYHYRLWSNINFTNVGSNETRRMFDFADKIVKNIAQVYKSAMSNFNSSSQV